MKRPSTSEIQFYFEILELAPGATIDEIKAAHQLLISAWHPDKFPQNSPMRLKAEERAKQINQAYAYLRQNWKENTADTSNHNSEAEARRRREDENRARAEAKERLRREAEAKAQRDAEARRSEEAEKQARAEAERLRREAEAKAQREAEARRREEAEEQARADAADEGGYHFSGVPILEEDTLSSRKGAGGLRKLSRSLLHIFTTEKRLQRISTRELGKAVASRITQGVAVQAGTPVRISNDQASITRNVFTSFAELGWEHGVDSFTDRPHPSCRVSADVRKFDLTWRKNGNLVLALESELALSLDSVLADFSKLLTAPCAAKVLVHRLKQRDVTCAIQRELELFRRHHQGDHYVVIAINDRHRTVEVHELSICLDTKPTFRFVGTFNWKEFPAPKHAGTAFRKEGPNVLKTVGRWYRAVRTFARVSWMVTKILVGILVVALSVKALMVVVPWVVHLAEVAPRLSMQWVDSKLSEVQAGTGIDGKSDKQDRLTVPAPVIQVPDARLADSKPSEPTAPAVADAPEATAPRIESSPALSESTDSPAKSELPVIAAESLLKEFNVDKSSAERQYKGSRVRVSGTISKIDKTSIWLATLRCKVGQIPARSAHHTSDAIVIEGTIRGKSFWRRTVDLEPCTIVELPPLQ